KVARSTTRAPALQVLAVGVGPAAHGIHARCARVQVEGVALVADQAQLVVSVPAAAHVNLLLQLAHSGRQRQAQEAAVTPVVGVLVLGGAAPEAHVHATQVALAVHVVHNVHLLGVGDHCAQVGGVVGNACLVRNPVANLHVAVAKN